MKITELLETPIPNAGPNDWSKINGPEASTIGHGQEAQVIKNKNHPNVFKITGIPSELKNFGYMQYVLLSKKYSGVNPYFPRVVSIKQMPQGEPGRVAYIIEMEHLEDSGKLGYDDRIALSHKLFHGPELEEMLAYEKKGNTVFQYIVQKAVGVGATEAASFVKDKQFLQAINLIQIVKKKTGATIDMHDANYMIRRTAQGPQIVLTDPIAN
jgi:hypothetical protein